MDIHFLSKYPACTLSNLYPHEFTFGNVHFASMEGLLQGLKFEDTAQQRYCFGLSGFAAKKFGKSRNVVWQQSRLLWWNGSPINRDSEIYQTFLDGAYLALGENKRFRQALLDTKGVPLTHGVGYSDPHFTILTEREFCDRLMNLRNIIRIEDIEG